MPVPSTRPADAGPSALPLDGVPLSGGRGLFAAGAGRRRSVTTPAGTVLVRPVTPLDAGPVQDLVRGLSPASSFRRFHTPVRSLTPRQLAGMVDVDHRSRETLVAVDGRRVVGLAQYIAEPAGPAVDIAVVVADDRHRQGIGRAMMAELLDAAERAGHRTAIALVQADNRPVLDLLRTAGRTVVVRRDGSVVDVTIDLALDVELDLDLRVGEAVGTATGTATGAEGSLVDPHGDGRPRLDGAADRAGAIV